MVSTDDEAEGASETSGGFKVLKSINKENVQEHASV
jgi:hypothetical protein